MEQQLYVLVVMKVNNCQVKNVLILPLKIVFLNLEIYVMVVKIQKNLKPIFQVVQMMLVLKIVPFVVLLVVQDVMLDMLLV